MKALLLHWSERGSAKISTAEELDRLLDQLTLEAQRTRPFIVYAVNNKEDCLAMGLGRTESVLSFIPKSGLEDNLTSVGDINASGTIDFYAYGHLSEFGRSQCIPLEIARSAMRAFVLSGTLSRLDRE